jgi:hypothetical protein
MKKSATVIKAFMVLAAGTTQQIGLILYRCAAQGAEAIASLSTLAF